MYTIFFMAYDGKVKAVRDFFVKDDNSFFDSLADALYIEQELTPVSPEWRRELATHAATKFTYHNTEFVTVEYGWNHDKYNIFVFDE